MYYIPINIQDQADYASFIFVLHTYIYFSKQIPNPILTGCLNMICQTSNQHIFWIKWHFKQKLLIFGILSRGDLSMDNQFLACLSYAASTASDLQDVKIQVFWSQTASNLRLWD
jgi:hypothetical protein